MNGEEMSVCTVWLGRQGIVVIVLIISYNIIVPLYIFV
jgi:hypothetical protein